MKEINVIPALRTELPLHLIGNPDRAVAQAMDMAALVEACGLRQPHDVGTCGGGIPQRHGEEGRHFVFASNHR